MFHHVPSGSKSSGSGLATGWVFWNALRFATSVAAPVELMRTTALSRPRTPCEQPAPPISAYMVLPMNAMSATPLVSAPVCALVWLDGSLLVTVVRTPCGVIFEILPPTELPVYGPIGGITCGQCPAVDCVPPLPPSATYRLPSGPNFNPRGL